MDPVIVFGPTGQVGSVAALTASTLGTTVWLAMRNTSKPIPSLSQLAEKEGRFQRVVLTHQRIEGADVAEKRPDYQRLIRFAG